MRLRRCPDPFGNTSVHLIDTDQSGVSDTYCGTLVLLKNTGGWEEEYEGEQGDITCRDCLDEVLAMVDEHGPWAEIGE